MINLLRIIGAFGVGLACCSVCKYSVCLNSVFVGYKDTFVRYIYIYNEAY